MNLLSLSNASWQVSGRKILESVDFELAEGEVLGLIGPNGAGKSSLLKIMAGLLDDFSGTYQFESRDFKSWEKKELAKELGYLEQGAPVHWPLKGRRVVELGRLPFQGMSETLSEQDQRCIAWAIEQTQSGPFIDRSVDTLSGGERLRILLARLLAGKPKVILADEPTAALDPYHQLHVMEILRDHAHQEGGGVVVVLHDLNLAARFCDRLVVLDQGKVVANDSVDQILASDILQKTYHIDLLQFHNEEKFALAPWARRQLEPKS
jgi:iron complex transport system ATP-binding protein